MNDKRKRRFASDEAHSWARNLRLNNPLAKLVLCMLTLYVDCEGRCWVGMQQLADDCELSVDTVRARLQWLENVAGVIKREQRWISPDGVRNGARIGRQTTDEIALLLDGTEAQEAPTVAGGVDSVGTRLGPDLRQGPKDSDSSNHEPLNARARARDGEAPRAPARSKIAAGSAKSDPLRFVCLNTHLWRALETYRAARGEKMPKFIHHGQGEHVNHTGTYFRASELSAASLAGRATGPPDDSDIADDTAMESQPGHDDDAGQSAAGLRGVAGSVDDRAGSWGGGSSSAYG